MSSSVRRAFAILEHVAAQVAGASLQETANTLDLPLSATYRHLAELVDMGYLRQDGRQGLYIATTKLVSMGFTILAERGIADLAQPILDKLARDSGELVRLAVTDGEHLTFVARAQGARGGLIYDGDMGQEPVLFASSTGLAWLSQGTDEQAIARIARQGLGPPNPLASNTPATMAAVLDRIARARRDGYATVVDSANPGTSAIAAPIVSGSEVLGTISIAGPSIRFTPQRMAAVADSLQAAVAELAKARLASPALTNRRGWVWAEDPRQAPEPASLAQVPKSPPRRRAK